MSKEYLELGLKYHNDCKDLLFAHKDELPITSMKSTLQKYTKYADEQIIIIMDELKAYEFNIFIFLFLLELLFIFGLHLVSIGMLF